MARIDELFVKLRRHIAEHGVYPVATAADVATTEDALGVRLPDSYRQFVTEFSNGANLYGGQEVSAVGQGNAQIVPIQQIQQPRWFGTGSLTPEALAEQIPIREGGSAPLGSLIPFSLDGNGNAWCFLAEELSVDREYQIAYYSPENRMLYRPLDDFFAWLNIVTIRQEEIIRTMYDDAVIYGELALG